MDQDVNFLRIFGQFYLNAASHEHENLRAYDDEYFQSEHENLASAISQAIHRGKHIKLERLVPRRDVLLAFERFVEGLDHEVALIATGPAADVFDHIAASRGNRNAVVPPLRIVVPHLEKRTKRRMKTFALVVHNHPSNWLTEFAEGHLGVPLGPSSQDRVASHRWRNSSSALAKYVRFEMLLFESGHWRDIRLPSVEQIAEQIAQLVSSLRRI